MSRPIKSTVPATVVSVVVMRPDDTVGSICVPVYAATNRKRRRLARYRCGCCQKGLVVARRGNKCKTQACHAEVVDVTRHRDKALTIPRRRHLTS